MGSDGAAGGPPGVRRGSRGSVGPPWGPVWIRISIVTDTGQSSGPSSPVAPKQGSDGNPLEPDLARRDGPDEPRRITRLSLISVRLRHRLRLRHRSSPGR